jgi:L-arabinose isomerase
MYKFDLKNIYVWRYLMLKRETYEFWFITGSQHLYGPDTLKEAASHSRIISESLGKAVSYKVIFKPILTTSEEILKICLEANSDDSCAGVIAWMHTFSPAKMWISGLLRLNKPLLHLHTQFNRNIPWDSIDMDFMNLNQSAHGDREFGFINTRMKLSRKVIAGHWEDPEVARRIDDWMKTAAACISGHKLKIARFGDNMRDVAVTEGDKVEAQIKFGWSVNGYGISELAEHINGIKESEINSQFDEYCELYDLANGIQNKSEAMASIKEQARIELGLKAFLSEGGFEAFTTTFEDLHGLKQLPGLAVQHLMAQGYGFGAEGDWKTAALVRTMKLMSDNTGTSFMEDYTYHLEQGNEMILGAHMLEVCPTVASSKPRIEVHPLSIGSRENPARLVFDGCEGPALCASLIDLGTRFRLIINEVDAVKIDKPMPRLPVARVLWKPRPSLRVASESWILAGGAHHTSFSFKVTTEQLEDLAEMYGMECIVINSAATIHTLKNELRWNEASY